MSPNMEESSSNHHQQVAAIMVPFLAHSHLNQLLLLSDIIASSYPNTISVHFVSSSIHIKQTQTRARDPQNPEKRIHFHGLPMDEFDSPPPNPDSSDKFPSQLKPLWIASLSLRKPFADLLRNMSHNFTRVVVIHDHMMSFVVQDVVSFDNAESYVFNPVSALTMAALAFHARGLPIPLERHIELSPFGDTVPDDVKALVDMQREPSEHRSGELFNTVRSLEADFLDLLAKAEISGGRKSWAVGPILPKKSSSGKRDESLEWLDGHEPNSVIYVSFGTTTSISDEQIREIALGLEVSKAKFLWVLRDADRGNVFDGGVRLIELPPGFEERVRGVGLVVRGWAPQIDILAHPSTGGFVSHCGWNSVLESLTNDVPLAVWPMHADQPRNAHFVTEILKAGIVVREWAKRKELTKESVIGEVVGRLMGSEEGDEVRKRVREIGLSLRKAREEGGESKVEMDSFVDHITRN